MYDVALFANVDISLSWEAIGIIIGAVASVLGIVFAFGKSFEKLSNHDKRMVEIENSREKLVDKLDNISNKLSRLTGQVQHMLNQDIGEDLAESHSPIQLNAQGKKVLEDSGIEKVIDPRFNDIVQSVKEKNPKNSYQVQEAVFEVVYDLQSDENLKNTIEEGAFKSGRSPLQVLYVGALNIRDRVIQELKFDINDVDKHDPSNKQKEAQ